MILLIALAAMTDTTSATIEVKARPFMTTGPACGPNLRKRIEDAVLAPDAPREAYIQLADEIFAPVPNKFAPGGFSAADVGQSGDDKLRANFKRQFGFANEDGSKPELMAMLDEIRAIEGMTADKFADMLMEETLEVTHLSLQLFEIDGQAIATELKEAAPGSTHSPSIYHASRDAGYEIARGLDLEKQLGLNPETVQVMIPGMPPFYFGDKTAGVEYFPLGKDSMSKEKGDSGLAGNQGNQKNDGGLHVSIYNRRDAAGLILTTEPYKVPAIDASRALVASRKEFAFTLDAERVKLVQGQKRNDHLVGGACYIGMETDRAAVDFVHAIQMDVMPAGFKIDHSQQMHVSIAAAGPKGIPHYKSRWALEIMEGMDNPEKLAFRKAHFNVYPALRSWMDVDELTDWGKYEDAASTISSPTAYGGIGMSYLLTDILGFKTSVVSPAISRADADARPSRTIWNGNWATEALRDSKFAKAAKSIKDWIKDECLKAMFVDEEGDNSFKASVTAEEYSEACKRNYAGMEEAITTEIIGSLRDSIERGIEIPSMEEAEQRRAAPAKRMASPRSPGFLAPISLHGEPIPAKAEK